MSARARILGLAPVLQVADVAASIRFYRDVLRCDVEFTWGNPPTYAGLEIGPAELHLAKGEVRLPAVITFFCTGLDTLFEQFRAGGARIESPISVEPYGMREFAISDLDGHRLVFGESMHTQAKG